ncbi:L-threonylcarbamoyladenylate synthase [Sporosarcina jeotgali]|uniref:Threonylcarbamoyl-AMP synthase n=1 Tax=Sporosarcina jeotgali TaxID=3020056 RepID=A0ABZ0KYJ0_9BACL|nr:L-threonylcarbamoyladenylate synthase [Sporosarcina sp. B2O-1]WOV84658.1 L-threonylcarbamoyladenylate synthase [Sporosarcina sp. B2O-1]
MNTQTLEVDKGVDNDYSYQQTVDCLRNGGLVAFPTETVYGLGALATDPDATKQIFEAKGRPSDNPLIVHIGTKEEVNTYAAEIPETAHKLMDAFWPGPLTLIFNEKPGVIAENVTVGRGTVGLRMPDHPVALKLLRLLGGPLAAPSANRSGKPSPTKASHVARDLDGRIPFILDGGATGVGVESTVIDMTSTPPAILRPGGITVEMIESVIGPVRSETRVEESEAPRAPGMKYKHYSPDAPVWLIEPDQNQIERAVQHLMNEGKKVAIIGPDELKTDKPAWYFATGAHADPSQLAAHLYDALRNCDETDADVILAVETPSEGMGIAVMNRLKKAADGKQFTDYTIESSNMKTD